MEKDLLQPCKTIYTAQSKKIFFARMLICKYVLENDAIPLNPFNIWGYFLYELVDRDLVRRGNNNIVRIVDEIWCFGQVSDGVLFEIEYAMKLQKQIKFFSAGSRYEDIKSISISELEFEPDACSDSYKTAILAKLTNYMYNSR